MGDVAFGKDFQQSNHVPWLLNLLGCVPGATAGYSKFFKWCADEMESKKKTWESEEYPNDIVAWLLKAFVEKDVSAAPSENSCVVIIAGRCHLNYSLI